MVAIAIVGITSVSALEAVGGDMRTAEKARRAIEAEALATSRLDFMELLTDRELQALPDTVDPNSITAELTNGVLHVTIAKRPESQPKKIEVKVS